MSQCHAFATSNKYIQIDFCEIACAVSHAKHCTIYLAVFHCLSPRVYNPLVLSLYPVIWILIHLIMCEVLYLSFPTSGKDVAIFSSDILWAPEPWQDFERSVGMCSNVVCPIFGHNDIWVPPPTVVTILWVCDIHLYWQGQVVAGWSKGVPKK